MTEQKTVKNSSPITNKVTGFVMILFMITALFFSGHLLKWAIDDKFGNLPKIEGTKITAEMREQQLACLAKNVYYEAGSEPFEGKIAVAQVVMNRVASGRFPDDICQTIYQKNVFYQKVVCQFSWYCDRSTTVKPIHKVNYDESMTAAKKVLLEGFRLPSLEGALFFHASYVTPEWNKKPVAKIGRHIFYK